MKNQMNKEFRRVPAILVKQPLGDFYVASIQARPMQVCYADRLKAILEMVPIVSRARSA